MKRIDDGFIGEMIHGRHESRHENRLSQVFCACFNNSKRFQELTCQFFEIKPEPGLKCITQDFHEQYDRRNIIDIRIETARGTPRAIIENKIDEVLTKGQLRHYKNLDTFKNCKKIALVKYLPGFYVYRDWQIQRWSDFYYFICKRVICKTKNSVDSFLLTEFSKYLKELDMDLVSKITESEFRDLAKAFYNVREKDVPYFGLAGKPVFETANNYLEILEAICDRARQDPDIKRKIGKNFRFTPYIGWWSNEGDRKRSNVWLGVEIAVNNRRCKTKIIGTGISFTGKQKHSRGYHLQSYAEYKKGNWQENKSLHKVEFEPYCESVLKFWRKHLLKG